MTDSPDWQLTVKLNASPSSAVPGPDSPDYQLTIQVVPSAQKDAPDWQVIAVGPGGTPISPTPTPALAVIVQKASGGTIDTATSVSVSFANVPAPGNQIIVILASIFPDGVLEHTYPAAPPAGWSCLAWSYWDGYNPIGMVAYRHVVQTGDGKAVTLPIAAYNSGVFVCMAAWEVAHSGQPITSSGTKTANGSSDNVSTQGITASSSAFGTIGISAGFNFGSLGGVSPITFNGGNPHAVWGADAFIYDTSGAAYGMMLTALAQTIAASVAGVTAEYNFTPVNPSNPGAVALTLLFPPAS